MSKHRIIETSEHRPAYLPQDITDKGLKGKPIFFLENPERLCIAPSNNKGVLCWQPGYYVGADWLVKNETAIYVAPKFEGEEFKTDYLRMLLSCLHHTDVIDHTDDLYEIKFEDPFIEIEQDKDLLTPLLAIQFLSIVKVIGKKGLKKSYYKDEHNLSSKIKGRPLVGKTIAKNHSKGNIAKTYCCYEEFGVNGYENRLIKKTLLFVRQYLASIKNRNIIEATTPIFDYVMPFFENVSDAVDVRNIKNIKSNIFFKEYTKAIQLCLLILKRYGYNMATIKDSKTVAIPPFWIDMAKLFELYALSLLKDVFGKSVHYHYKRRGNELDYLLNSSDPEYRMVVDAKYKKIYQSGSDTTDMRQLSGYARLTSVANELKVPYDKVIDCLIIYPTVRNGLDRLSGETDLMAVKVDNYTNFYKVGINLPLL